ncbi:hypothetical protein [Belliella marina]|uniref:hypothetical protein n=1 Tax=Belliella marina TaxID=1644146 RepID=UPI00366BB922
MDKKQNIPILEIAILEMARVRKGRSFSPVEVLEWIFPQDWVHFLPEIVSETIRMQEEGKISIDSNLSLVGLDEKMIGEIRISLNPKTT